MANSTYPAMTPQKPPSGRRASRTADTKQEPSAGKSPRQDSDGETRRVRSKDSKLERLEENRCQHTACGAHFNSAEELNRRTFSHRAQGHPDIPEERGEVCRWSRCGQRYVSFYYWRQHCEKKCRYLNDIDQGPPRKSKNSLLTVSQGDDRATDGPARQAITGTAPSQTTRTNKRKISVTKPPRGGKKTQKSRKRSLSPPSPIVMNSFASAERASSPEEDQFVTSRRPSAASIFPEGDEDTSTTLPLAYPPFNRGVGRYPHQPSVYHGPPPVSAYHYDSRAAPYGSLPSFVSVDPNTALPAFVSDAPIPEAPVAFNLDPFRTHGVPPQAPVVSPTAPVQAILPNGYEPPVSV
ncbi:hypothetical protein V8F33_007860 [Rhypophila sp. PSN 637]